MSDRKLYELAERVGAALKSRALMLTTAESCTGGWVAQAITAVPGSSEWFDRGFVTYTYRSKSEVLGVAPETLAADGAVSEACVGEMTAGALAASDAGVALAVSGTAGPSGGTPEKPVGTVCFAWQMRGGSVHSETVRFAGDREAVRRQSVERALTGLIALLESETAHPTPSSGAMAPR
jgi:nicotinamide-nucleotide amidase